MTYDHDARGIQRFPLNLVNAELVLKGHTADGNDIEITFPKLTFSESGDAVMVEIPDQGLPLGRMVNDPDDTQPTPGATFWLELVGKMIAVGDGQLFEVRVVTDDAQV